MDLSLLLIIIHSIFDSKFLEEEEETQMPQHKENSKSKHEHTHTLWPLSFFFSLIRFHFGRLVISSV